MDFSNLGKILSTGNKARDIGIGALYGLANVSASNKYIPYMTANWAGNGLARTGIGYMINPNYRNYADAAQSMAALYNKNKLGSTDTGENRLLDSILGKMSSIGGNLGTWAQKKWNDYTFGKDNNVGDMSVRIWDNQV